MTKEKITKDRLAAEAKAAAKKVSKKKEKITRDRLAAEARVAAKEVLKETEKS